MTMIMTMTIEVDSLRIAPICLNLIDFRSF